MQDAAEVGHVPDVDGDAQLGTSHHHHNHGTAGAMTEESPGHGMLGLIMSANNKPGLFHKVIEQFKNKF